MKGIKRIFIWYLTSLVIAGFSCANADDAADIARAAATRRGTSTTVVRQQSNNTDNATAQVNTNSGISRSTNLSNSGTTLVRDRTTSTQTTNSSGRGNVVVRDSGTRSSSDSSGQTVSARTTTTVMPRASTSGTSSVVSTPSRAAITRATTTAVSRTANTTNATPQQTSARSAASTISRNATINRTGTTQSASTATARSATVNAKSRLSRAGTVTAQDIINRDYTQCREVYYSCMDEFCANKDSQLKRCACSSRVNEFDSVKNQLSQVEDKLLDFNQRLLTVNMDKEDAEAIFQATEGELAFQQDDTSESKKLLDEISEKLNTTFDTSTFDTNLAPISLSLNVDAAFDSLDSMAGSSTTTKTGTDLYNAALPICREMALEVCTEDELDIIESGYQMVIEQDCNTVAKSYQTQQDLAREKIREGSALLDMSRLDIYQKRNSDDILTCKKKMLDMLTNTAVCGTDLQKCLDISGQYIDPSTGEAILTVNLVNLGNLITRPGANQTWTSVPGNDKFVTYLNSKKMYLESATENCQDIADYVWDEFIEDALAQIKLAQENKLEEVRQSCTTLTAQCLTDSAESIEDFDSRALSIFGVEADKTAKQMCAEIQTACTALLDTVEGGQDWTSGITNIATEKTFETILQTCREVGRACIIQSCKSISGNFGLCENIQTSVNRKSIINRDACWDEVVNCVASAGIDSINNITELQAANLDPDTKAFYTQLYGSYNIDNITNDEMDPSYTDPTKCTEGENNNCIYDICETECGFDSGINKYTNTNSDECKVCRLAERIWGNCESHPSQLLSKDDAHNKIKIPVNSNQETLLSWFAKNTNTQNESDSCRDTSCGTGYISMWDSQTSTYMCVPRGERSDDGLSCPSIWKVVIKGYNNCCSNNGQTPGARDTFGNCCLGKTLGATEGINGVKWDATSAYWGKDETTIIPANEEETSGNISTNGGLCLPTNAQFVVAFNIPENDSYYGNGGIGFLFCVGEEITGNDIKQDSYPNGKTVKCNGKYVIVTKSGRYLSPTNNNNYPQSFYRQQRKDEDIIDWNDSDIKTCTLVYENGTLNWKGEGCIENNNTEPTNRIIQY